jgi:hypothetical protein
MLEQIISGGQSGVDQAALDFAIGRGIPHGGTCPRGRLSENGPIPARYKLIEHPFSASYPPRTLANIENSCATLVFTNMALNEESGSLLTVSLCKKVGKPCVVIRIDDKDEAASVARGRKLLEEHDVKILNVAGSRGSRKPDTKKMKRLLGLILDGFAFGKQS